MGGRGTYAELAKVCKRRGLRLLLCTDIDSRRNTMLTTIDVTKDGELVVRVSLRELTIDDAAESALNALQKAGIT